MKKALNLLLFISFLFLSQRGSCKEIPLNDKNIHVAGAAYIFRSPGKLFYKRFSEKTLNAPEEIRMFKTITALTTAGISIQFKTNSSFIHLTFSPEPGRNEGGFFRVLKDGQVFKTIAFKSPGENDVNIKLDSLSSKMAIYEIILPTYTDLALTGLEIADGSKLVAFHPAKRKTYLAFGDSITHGRGQGGASYFTYPFLLSQKLNMNFYNLAIGGSKVSIPIAEMSKHLPKADVITLLIGYNDMNGGGHNLERFEKDYRRFLSILRKNQKKAKIFCITLTYTKRKENPKTHLTPDDFRRVIEKVVTEYQASDKKLYLIKGDEITSAENLQPGTKTDAVHLTVKGARLFADSLYKEMEKSL